MTAPLKICSKCQNTKEYKEYFKIQCTDFDEYLKCQSKCVSSERKTPVECINDSACIGKCESKCKNVWPG